MAVPTARHKSKKIKFRKYSFALSDREKRRYDRVCAYEKIGFRQLVKKALREYNKTVDLPEEILSDENQLDLFEQRDLFGNPVRKIKSSASLS